MTTEWMVAPGAFNAFRMFVRRRTRFSTYHRCWSRLIGWPKVIAMTGPPETYEARWREV